MATRFIDEATQQLAPGYDAQIQAAQAQIPAIQNLYEGLSKSLDTYGQTQTQDILESANRRGVLNSTIPVNLQTELAKSLIAQRGQLGAQRASDIAGVTSQINNIGLQRAQSIADLARSLESQDLARQQLELERYKFDRSQAQSAGIASLASKLAGQNTAQQAQSPLSLQGVGLKDPSKGGVAGYSFNFGGKPISAIGFAQVQGVNPADILYSMAQSGDVYAANAYRDIVNNGQQITSQIAQKYPALFWGTNLIPQAQAKGGNTSRQTISPAQNMKNNQQKPLSQVLFKR